MSGAGASRALSPFNDRNRHSWWIQDCRCANKTLFHAKTSVLSTFDFIHPQHPAHEAGDAQALRCARPDSVVDELDLDVNVPIVIQLIVQPVLVAVGALVDWN